MCSTDVSPNRITAAEKAATAFIKAQPGGSRIGLVAFAGVAGLLVPPTNDTGKLLDAIKGLTTSRGTAIGQAILTSIDAIAAGRSVGRADRGHRRPQQGRRGYAADAIVVLTDGANTQGVDPATAAKEAAARRLRVYTIGFGTTTPAPMVCDSSQIGSGPAASAVASVAGSAVVAAGSAVGTAAAGSSTIDEDALKQVASTTGAQYYRAQNADQLQSALANLPRTITVTHKQVDIADVFAGIGGLLVASAIGLSLWWNRVRSVPHARPAAAVDRRWLIE